jgi:hypothetical protein
MQVTVRISEKLLPAFFRAEVKGSPMELGLRSRCDIHAHAAHGVYSLSSCRLWRRDGSTLGMMVMHVPVGLRRRTVLVVWAHDRCLGFAGKQLCGLPQWQGQVSLRPPQLRILIYVRLTRAAEP